MKRSIFRRILVILIFAVPLVSYPGCKKQARCGCGKDILFTLTDTRAHVNWDNPNNIYFATLSDPYSTYIFCNPSEWSGKLKDYKSGDELLVSGHAYWECNYLYQAGNSSYNTYYKTYVIQVTNVYMNLFGK